MKIVHVERLIDKGGFSSTKEWQLIESQVMQAIKTIEWPPSSGSFTLYPESGKKRGEGNGVKPIKEACMLHLESLLAVIAIEQDAISENVPRIRKGTDGRALL